MKGLQALLEWELKTVGLYTIKFPLTTLIDYRGFRLVATTILPLSSSNLERTFITHITQSQSSIISNIKKLMKCINKND